MSESEKSDRGNYTEISEPGFSGPSVSAVAAIAAASIFLMGGHASATTIIQDSFTSGSNNGVVLANYGAAGLTPSGPGTTNLPGGTYQPGSSQAANLAAEFSAAGDSSGLPVASFRSDTGNSTDLTLGAYNTGTLQITADILYGDSNSNTTERTSAPTAITSTSFTLLGFNGQNDSSGSEYDGHNPYQGGPSTSTGFTGLRVNGDGSLQQFSEGVAVGSAIAFVGTYDPIDPTTLSYEINTTTGAISDVSFGDSTATYDFANSGAFATVDTSNVEFGGFAPDTGANGDAGEAFFSSLNVSSVGAVPEPASLALVALSGLGLLTRRRRGQSDTPPPRNE